MRRRLMKALMVAAATLVIGVALTQRASAVCDWVIIGYQWNEETQQEEPIWDYQCWEEWRDLNIIGYDSRTGGGVCNANVDISQDFGNGSHRNSDCSGYTNFGVWRYSNIGYNVSASGYYSHGGSVYVDGNATVWVPIERIWHNLNFVIRDQTSGATVCGAHVHISHDFGNGTDRTTDCSGFANFGVTNYDISYTIDGPYYVTISGNIHITDHVSMSLNMPRALGRYVVSPHTVCGIQMGGAQTSVIPQIHPVGMS